MRRAKWKIVAGLLLIAVTVLFCTAQEVRRRRPSAADRSAPRPDQPTTTTTSDPALAVPGHSGAAVVGVSFASPAFAVEYRVLLERTLFTRNGRATMTFEPGTFRPQQQDTPGDRGPRAPSNSAESALVFRAAMRQGPQFIAFIEDNSTGKTWRLGVGATIGRGRIVQITLDQLVYELNGKVITIGIGWNLEGSMASIVLPTRPSTGPSDGTASSASTPAPSAAEESILERMRKKRQQEEGGK